MGFPENFLSLVEPTALSNAAFDCCLKVEVWIPANITNHLFFKRQKRGERKKVPSDPTLTLPLNDFLYFSSFSPFRDVLEPIIFCPLLLHVILIYFAGH